MTLLVAEFRRHNKNLKLYYSLVHVVLNRGLIRVNSLEKLLPIPPKEIPSAKTLQKRLTDLVDANILTRERTDSYSPYCYDLSSQAMSGFISTSGYFRSFSDAKHRKRLISPSKLQSATPTLAESGIEQWKAILAPSLETEEFLAAYRELVIQHHHYLGQRTPPLHGDLFAHHLFLPRVPFPIDFPPESFGRVGSKPYCFVGKQHLPWLRPAEDPHLHQGSMFMVDFRSFEPRLLAHLAQEPLLLEMAQSSESVYQEIRDQLLNEFPIVNVKKLVLSWMNGAGPTQLSEFIGNQVDEELRVATARDIASLLDRSFPNILAMRYQLAEEWLENGTIRLDGLECPLERIPRGDKRGLKLRSRGTCQRQALAYLLQSLTGQLSVQIITAAASMDHAQLRLPVYDGFMFNCNKDKLEQAFAEIQCKIAGITTEMFPGVPMPLKLEWVASSAGVEYYDDFLLHEPATHPLDISREMSQGIMKLPMVPPATTLHPFQQP